jgi:hypothetical protein
VRLAVCRRHRGIARDAAQLLHGKDADNRRSRPARREVRSSTGERGMRQFGAPGAR